MMKIICLLLVASSIGFAKSHSLIRLNQEIKLIIGDTAVFNSLGLSVTLNGFTKHEIECAVPGKNCGAGYFPGVRIYPNLKVNPSEKCQGRVLPKECEVTYKIGETDNATYVMVNFIDVFQPCMDQADTSNRNSCILQVVKNGSEKPPFDPSNCDRIMDLAVRDGCYETIADKLQDPEICRRIKGVQHFQCSLLRARHAKNSEICKSLKRQDERASCIDSVSRINP